MAEEGVRVVVDDALVARERGPVTEDQSLVLGPNVRLRSLPVGPHGLATPVVHAFTARSPEGFSALLTTL